MLQAGITIIYTFVIGLSIVQPNVSKYNKTWYVAIIRVIFKKYKNGQCYEWFKVSNREEKYIGMHKEGNLRN